MPFTFRVVFSGICAFVPGQDRSFDDFQNPPTSATVVLPNLFRSKPVEGGTRESHIPTLEVDPGLGLAGDRSPQLQALVPTSRSVYFLSQERISFQATGAAVSPAGLVIANPTPAAGPPQNSSPRPGEEDFFWWVPKMEKIAPGSEKIRPEILVPGTTEAIGWVGLDRGRLSVVDRTAGVVTFKPIHGLPAHDQVASKAVALEIQGVERLRISFEDHTDRQHVVTRTLSLDDRPGLPQVVEIQVKNKEVDELLGLVPLRLNPLPDIDFNTYYDMSSTNVSERRLPVEQTSAAAQAAVFAAPIGILTLLHGGVCPPAAYSGVAAAAGPLAMPQGGVVVEALTDLSEKEEDNEQAA